MEKKTEKGGKKETPCNDTREIFYSDLMQAICSAQQAVISSTYQEPPSLHTVKCFVFVCPQSNDKDTRKDTPQKNPIWELKKNQRCKEICKHILIGFIIY